MAEEQSHDIFEGDIPTDLGKKKSPIWIKAAGLGVLICVLGAAAYVLNSESTRETVMNSTQSKVESFMTEKLGTTTGPDLNALSSPEQDEAKQLGIEGEIPSSSVIEIEPEELMGSTNDDLEEKSVLDIPADQQSSSFEQQILIDDSDPITITPPNQEVQTAAVNNSFASKDELKDLKNTVGEMHAAQQERINVLKSGIDLQTVSIERLQALVQSLNELKSELKELKQTSVPVQTSTTKVGTKAPANPPKTSTSKPVQSQSVKSVNTPDLILLGIDTWAGERFAQLQHKEQIHLLAMHESIKGWRITHIQNNSVTVTNESGESFEITN